MKYFIVSSKRYEKSFRKLLQSGKLAEKRLNELEYIITALAQGKVLNKKHKDHRLKGNLKDHRECHIGFDVLLVYRIREQDLVLVLVNVGTHTELFGA